MKILHFLTSINKNSGGITSYMQLLSNELGKMVDLIVVTGRSSDPITINNVDVRFLNLSLNRWLQLTKEIEQLLKTEMPDLVHINGIWQPQCWLFQKVAQQLRIKVVLSPHGMLEPWILSRHPFKKKVALALYQQKALSKVEYFHTTAQSELDQIRKLGYTQPALVIPNGVDISAIKQKREYVKIQNLLFLSRIHPKKGIELLIEAICQLNNKQLLVTIAGEGDANYVEKLKQLTEERNVSSQFNFVGGVYGNEKWELFQNADLFILPSYSENFGIVIAEALATGLPVITTTGTPWQELESENCGWWIDLGVDSLVRAISKALLIEPEEFMKMGVRGRKLVQDKYEINAVAIQMKEFYCQINSKM